MGNIRHRLDANDMNHAHADDNGRGIFNQLARVDQEVKELMEAFMNIKEQALTDGDRNTMNAMYETINWCMNELQAMMPGTGQRNEQS